MENLKQNPNPADSSVPSPSKAVQRPWQGTLLGVLNIIALIALALLIFGVFVSGSILAQFFPLGIFGGLGMALGFVFISIWILMFFVVRGIFKGAKWSIILSIVFTALGIMSTIPNISKMFYTLIIYIALLYLEIICLKDPYYNK